MAARLGLAELGVRDVDLGRHRRRDFLGRAGAVFRGPEPKPRPSSSSAHGHRACRGGSSSSASASAVRRRGRLGSSTSGSAASGSAASTSARGLLNDCLVLLRCRLAGRLLGLALGSDRLVDLRQPASPTLRRQCRRGRARPVTFTFLPTSFAASATQTSRPSSLPTPASGSCRPTSTSWTSTRRSLFDRRVWRELLALPLAEHDEVVEMLVLLRRQIEAAPRLLLELDQPRCTRPDQDRRDLGGDLDAVSLMTRARGKRAEPALDLDGGRRLRDDDSVTAARRALLRHHLARTVGDVLPRHLDEPERRDLDDVGLRPVALQLRPQRLLDSRPGSSGSPCR